MPQPSKVWVQRTGDGTSFPAKKYSLSGEAGLDEVCKGEFKPGLDLLLGSP